MHFVRLTFDKMPSASSLFLLSFLFQNFTSGNIRGIGPKFTEIIFTPRRRRSPKGGTRGDPEGRDGLLLPAYPGERVGPPLPLGRLLDPLRCL